MSPLQCSLPHELAPSLSFSRTCHGAVARPSPPWVGAPASLPPGTSAPVPQPRCRGGAWASRRSGGEGLCPSICKEGQCSNWRCRGGARTLPPPATHKVHGVRHPHPRDLAPELSPAGRRGATPLSPILTPPPRSATQRIPAPPPSPGRLCPKSMSSLVPHGAGRSLDSPSEAADGSFGCEEKISACVAVALMDL
jgi:hypothetical protein